MRTVTTKSRGFTLIELLTVVAIMMLVMGMALPNFIAMMKERKWSTAVGNIQNMIWRARAFATNERCDCSVEMQIDNSTTTMWLESESNVIESIPDYDWLQHHLGGASAVYWVRSIFYASGGSDKWCRYEWRCNLCGDPRIWAWNADRSEIGRAHV